MVNLFVVEGISVLGEIEIFLEKELSLYRLSVVSKKAKLLLIENEELTKILEDDLIKSNLINQMKIKHESLKKIWKESKKKIDFK